jgi:hypothetical protein
VTQKSARLAEQILKMATSNLPAGRAVWGRAMAAEFAVLQDRKLPWAIGCFVGALKWRLLDAWPLLLAAVAAGAAIDFLWMPVNWLLWRVGEFSAPTVFYANFLAGPALACCALATWRPRLALQGVILFSVAYLASAMWGFVHMGVSPMSLLRGDFNVMNGPPIAGLSAILCWCLIGALIGRRIGTREEALTSSHETR